ncbi:RBM34 family protein [Megaselia abdita]
MKKTKTKNEKPEKTLKKVDKKSKAIVSHQEKKEAALQVALSAKKNQLKKNPHSIDKKQLKEKKKELLDSIKKEKETQEAPKPKKKKNKPTTEPEPVPSPKKKNKKNKKTQEGSTPITPTESPKKKKKAKTTEETSQETVDPTKKKKKKKKAKSKDPKSGEDEEKKKSDPECTVFVGNLGQNIKKQQLVTLFKSYGTVVSVRLRTALGNTLFKHKSRKETECLNAYVVMDTAENAEKSLELSGTEFRGRHIRVTKSLKGNFLTDESSRRTVFVGNLKFKVTEETLHELFSSCGEIEAVRTMKNDQGCKGVGYVIFKSKEGVHLAQELNGTLVFGRPVRVEKYSSKKVADKAASKPKVTDGKKDSVKSPGKPSGKPKKTKKDEPKKKGDFRGVKTNIKKKKFNKKKLGGNPLQRKLAKKIAPKDS